MATTTTEKPVAVVGVTTASRTCTHWSGLWITSSPLKVPTSPFQLHVVYAKPSVTSAISFAGPGFGEVLPIIDSDLKKIAEGFYQKAMKIASDEASLSKFLTQSGTFMDGDLLVNREGVRIVSQSNEETPPLIKQEDNQISLADFDAIKVIGKGNGGIVRLVQHKWTGQFFFCFKVLNEEGNSGGKSKDDFNRQKGGSVDLIKLRVVSPNACLSHCLFVSLSLFLIVDLF